MYISYSMNIEDKKKKILEKLYQTNDEEILDIVYSLLEPKATYHTTAPASEAELKAVLEALEGVKRGEVISNEEAERDLDEWLGK